MEKLNLSVFSTFCLVWLTCGGQTGGAWHHVGAPQPVPVREVWGKVGARPLMMSVMFGGAAPQAKGHQVMHGPWEDIATVLLHRNVDVEDHEAPRGQAVALEQDGVHCGPKSHTEEFPAREVLCDQTEGLVVLVVNGMEGAVQPRNLMMQQVPQVILEVEEHHAAQDAQNKAQERGRLTG